MSRPPKELNAPEWREISKKLKFEIENSGKKKADIARELGVDHTNISAYANGRAFPSLITLKKLCRVLDCTYEDILGEL